MTLRSRREFLEQSMLAAAAAAAASSSRALWAKQESEEGDDDEQSSSPGEKLSVAVLGVNGRGGAHVDGFAGRKDTEITYIVDPDETIGKKAAEDIKKKTGREPKWVPDMREAFDDKQLDIVSIATPNHWHALASIWAMQAGKDVYVEKPVSHNVSEGRRAVQVARKLKKICQAGTQSRSMKGMREAMKYIHGGKIGTVSLARGLCYKNRGSIGPRGDYPVPANINYDLWLGPAPLARLTRPKLHYDWHWQWPYGNGDLGNQGIHQMDLCRWALGVDTLSKNIISFGGRLGYIDAGDTANTQVTIHDFGDKTLIFEVRGLKSDNYKGARVGIIIEGSDGYVVMTSYSGGSAFDKEGKKVKDFSGGREAHFANFVKAVRSRKHEDLNGDILDGHLSSALCHTANISYRLGGQITVADAKGRVEALKPKDEALETFERTMKHLEANEIDLAKTNLQFGMPLAFDPAKEKFVGNAKADEMLSRDYRPPYVVPDESKI